MTNWENHETTSRYQSHLILKVVAFRFVHVFASLYYYAFADLTTHKSDNLLRVVIQLAGFMVAGQLWKNVMETLLPFVQRKWRQRQKKRATNAQFTHSTVFNNSANGTASNGGVQRNHHSVLLAGIELHNTNAAIHEQCVWLEQASDKAWEEAELEPYDMFEDYTEMLIQFGYVSFFSLAFPLAPLLALANNVLELRTDAFKLCHAKQRPIARKASGIGVWFHVLQPMSVLAVLTNCLHIAFTMSFVDDLASSSSSSGTTTTKVWVAFGVEHVLLAVKVWMMVVIPSMPKDVQDHVLVERERAKEESARAMVAKLRLLPDSSAAAGGATADVAAAPRETMLNKNDRAATGAGAVLVDLRRWSSKDTKTNQI
ncbi:Anoctamin, partial [Globisporangium splendens]